MNCLRFASAHLASLTLSPTNNRNNEMHRPVGQQVQDDDDDDIALSYSEQ